MEKIIVNNYGSFDVVFSKGKGATMYDVNGKKYIFVLRKHLYFKIVTTITL